MKQEPLSRYITINLTPTERAALERMAATRGASMSGLVRLLIRTAATREQEKDANTEAMQDQVGKGV